MAADSNTTDRSTRTPGAERITLANVVAILAILGFFGTAGGALMTLGGMRSKAEATEATAGAAKAAVDANTTRLAVHDAQIKALEAALARIEGKIDAALTGRKP